MKLRYFNDPGHGWVGIKRKLLVEIGVADKISFYSYERGASVYLEEDCDAPIAIKALKAAGHEVKLVASYRDKRSPIRSYASYQKPAESPYVAGSAIHRGD